MQPRGTLFLRAACALSLITAVACGGGGGGAPDAGPDAPLVDADLDADVDTVAPTSSASPAGGAFFHLPAEVTITASEPATIYYTTDGSEPTTSSPSGASPLVVTGIAAGTPLRFFAVDDAGNAEAPANSEVYTIDRAATLRIALDGTVTVTDPVAGLALTGTATYDAGEQALAVTLTVQNTTPRLLFNLKAMFGAASQGAAEGAGTIDGVGFAYFGPEALDAAAAKAATFTIGGVDGTADPVTLALTFRTDPFWAFNGLWDLSPDLMDSACSGMGTQVNTVALGYRGADADHRYQAGVFSPDGRFLYLAPRNQPQVHVLDTTTLEVAVGATLSGDVGAVSAMAMSPDGESLYAVLLVHQHAYRDPSKILAICAGGECLSAAPDLHLVRLRRTDLVETGRATLVTAHANPRVRAFTIAISGNGQRAAVPLLRTGQVALVDLEAMTVIDTDPGTAGIQHADVSAHFTDPLTAALAPDGSRLYVASRREVRTLAVVDTATWQVTELSPPTVVTPTAPRRSRSDPTAASTSPTRAPRRSRSTTPWARAGRRSSATCARWRSRSSPVAGSRTSRTTRSRCSRPTGRRSS